MKRRYLGAALALALASFAALVFFDLDLIPVLLVGALVGLVCKVGFVG